MCYLGNLVQQPAAKKIFQAHHPPQPLQQHRGPMASPQISLHGQLTKAMGAGNTAGTGSRVWGGLIGGVGAGRTAAAIVDGSVIVAAGTTRSVAHVLGGLGSLQGIEARIEATCMTMHVKMVTVTDLAQVVMMTVPAVALL